MQWIETMRFICLNAPKSTVLLTGFLFNAVASTFAFSEYGVNTRPFKTATLNLVSDQLLQPKSSVSTPSNERYGLDQTRRRVLRALNPSSRLFQSSRNNNNDGYKFFDGAPSTPGFKPGQFDKLTSWAMSTASNRPIVEEYEPDGFWLWTQWEGTTREMTYQNIIIAIFWALLVDLYAYHHYTIYVFATAAVNGGDINSLLGDISWISLEIPHSKDPFIETLTALNSLWEYQLSLTIFTLSFFVNHAYNHWRMVYFCTRAIQGRINDLCMLVTIGAKRSAPFGTVNGTTGYRAKHRAVGQEDHEEGRDAKLLVRDVTRLLRMSHTFFWSATPTVSDGFGDVHHSEGGIAGDADALPTNFDPSQFGPILLSSDGLKLLVRYGQLTQCEVDALVATGLPPSQYPYILLEWAGIRAMDGIDAGELRGDQGMVENLLRQLNMLRAEYFNIGDMCAGRMPLGYVQLMEVLVDTLWTLAPLALYTKMGAFNIVSTALLTLFFKGLLELSKSFLDPFGTEGYKSHNIRVDVLVSELNFGAARRWIDSGDALPSQAFDEKPSYIEGDLGSLSSVDSLSHDATMPLVNGSKSGDVATNTLGFDGTIHIQENQHSLQNDKTFVQESQRTNGAGRAAK